jgi:Lrp/AsnC family leucine-responsive transcriptional regulator
MEANGVILATEIRLDPATVGYPICAFVQVAIERPTYEEGFLRHVTSLREVQECHCITGAYAFLLKVRARNPRHLEELLRSHLKSIPGVTRTESLIVLSTYKETSSLPLGTKSGAAV